MTSFAAFREFTSWTRPGRDHGCPPVEIVPGLWTAHYHDIDSPEKLKSATGGAPIKLVVNSALCQCASRDGFYGPNVKVMEIVLEDDPDPRKYFDQGKPTTSNCKDGTVPLVNRFAGEAIADFDACSKAIDETLASGGHALVHCHASLSRSVAFLLAHLMRTRGLSLLGAAQLMKPKWDAVWPCDRLYARPSNAALDRTFLGAREACTHNPPSPLSQCRPAPSLRSTPCCAASFLDHRTHRRVRRLCCIRCRRECCVGQSLLEATLTWFSLSCHGTLCVATLAGIRAHRQLRRRDGRQKYS